MLYKLATSSISLIRWSAFKAVGVAETDAIIIKDLDGTDPLLYAAKKAIGHRQLTEDEARDTARRAYSKNTSLRSADIGKAIGRSRQTVDSYTADLRAATQLGLRHQDIPHAPRLCIPRDRIAKRLGVPQQTISNHLAKMPELANLLNTDLSRGFTVAQVAEKHGWTEPMVWSLALEGKEDLERFKELGWGLRTWNLWNWNDCDQRFGDNWPGRIPARMIAHSLYYFSGQNDLVFAAFETSFDLERRSGVSRRGPSWGRCYNRRSSLERINSRLDNDFCFEKHYIRGKTKMQTRMGLSLAVMMAMALGHIKEGRKAQMRSLVRPLSKAA